MKNQMKRQSNRHSRSAVRLPWPGLTVVILALGCLAAAAAGLRENHAAAPSPKTPPSLATKPPKAENAPAMAAKRVYIDANGNKTAPPPRSGAVAPRASRLVHFRDLPVRKSAVRGGGEFVRFPGGFRVNTVATKGTDGKIKIDTLPGPRAVREEPQS